MAVRDDTIPFDLRSLEIFLAVTEHGAMAVAARTLGITQPAVSLAVADLEQRAGAKLFDRAVRPLGLTPAGAILRQRASMIIAEARQIAPLLREAAHRKLPALRLGLVDSLSQALSVPLAKFLESHAAEVSVLSGLTEAHASALLTRRLDVLLGVDELADWDGLERWELVSEPYMLALPQGTEPPATVTALRELTARVPLVRFSARSKTGRDIDRHLQRLKIDVPRTHEFDIPYGVTAMVAAGDAIAISTPLCLLASNCRFDNLVAAPLPGPRLTRTLTLVARVSELGALPRDLTLAARDLLARDVAPCLRSAMPWLGEHLAIPRRRTP